MKSPMLVAVCEDDSRDMELLLKALERCGVPAIWETYTCAEDFLDVFLPGKYDLVFLDIYMKGTRGVEAAAAIRARDREVVLAFTTASPEHALDGYRLGVLKYLEKPVAQRDVAETLALTALKRQAKKTIPLLVGGEVVDLLPNNILFFETDAAAHAVRVHLADRTLRTSQAVRLEDIEALVPKPQFLRCHRGYIVNLRRVRGFDGHDFVMDNGEKAYVRLRDGSKMRAAYEAYMFDLTRGARA